MRKVRLLSIIIVLYDAIVLFLFAICALKSLASRETMEYMFTHLSYYIILMLVGTFAVSTIRCLPKNVHSITPIWKNNWHGILLAVILVMVVFSSVDIEFKTLSDETNLIAVSRSMLEHKTCYNTTMAHEYYGNQVPLKNILPIRPLVHPFFTQVIHIFMGYHYRNAFVLNSLVLFGLLILIYGFVRKHFGYVIGWAAMLLVLSMPVVSIFATCGGFDLLNSTFLLFVLYLVYIFLKESSETTFTLLFTSMIVLANIRYESIIYVVIILALLTKNIKRSVFKATSPSLCSFPLFMLPLLWQYMLNKENWAELGNGSLFSLHNVLEHGKTLLVHLPNHQYTLPYAGYLILLSIIIYLSILLVCIFKKRAILSCQKQFILIMLVTAIVNVLLSLAYFGGEYNHPSGARFFIFFSIVLAFGPIALKWLIDSVPDKYVLLFAIACFLFYHPIAIHGKFTNQLILNRQTKYCIDFLSSYPDRKILLINARPGQYTVLGYGAVDFNYANNNPSIMNLVRIHLYSDIIVFQEIEYRTQKPTNDTALAGYKLATLREEMITGGIFLRISKVLAP